MPYGRGSVSRAAECPSKQAYKKNYCYFHSFDSIRSNSKLNSFDLIGFNSNSIRFKSRFVLPALCL